MHVNYLLTYEGKNAYLFGVSPTFLYFCRQMMKRQNTLLYIFLLPCLLMVGTLCACSGDKKQMQQQLLSLQSKFEKGTLSSKDFSLADSLVRCYEGQGNRDEALSLLITGDIYKTSGDYSTSLDYYLKANKVSENLDDLLLKIWVNREEGDLYFEQGMYSDCINYYKTSYAAAQNSGDTLRIALASMNMGRVFMIKNDVDSILFYLKQDIELATKVSKADNEDVIRVAKSMLADIYIQIEEYDKAKALLTREQRDDYNWAYWHLGQHHTDSAYWYFSRIIENKPWKTKVEYLPILAKLEEERGNREHSLSLYRDLAAAKDSLQVHSQVEKTRKVKILHEFNQIKQERDEAQEQSEVRGIAISLICLVVAIVALTAYSAWKRYREKKELELAQEIHLRQEEEQKSKQILASLQHNHLTLGKLEQSPLFERIKFNAGKEHFRLTDEEWQELATLIDDAYGQFTQRLRNLYGGISEYELQICYLVKLDISSVNIGKMLCKSNAAIGMARKRLYKKLTGKDGTASQFNDFIQSL